MKKIIAKSFILLGLANIAFITFAREIRTPLSWRGQAFFRGFMHYPVPRPKPDDTCWNFDVWGGAFGRTAPDAFTAKHGTKKESLAGLVFGKETFKGIDAFGSFDSDTLPCGLAQNPFLEFANLSPRFDFREEGAFFGITIDRGLCCGKWHVGMRAAIPFKSTKAEIDCCATIQDITLDDVCRTQREEVITNVNGNASNQRQIVEDSYAYRLDFLASLRMDVNNTDKLVVFNDTDKNGNMTINNIDITANQAGTKQAPVHVIYREDGSVPKAPFALRNEQGTNPLVNPTPANDLEFLNNDGSGPFTSVNTDGVVSQRARFGAADMAPNRNYTPLGNNQENQSKLWVSPVATQVQNSDFDIVAEARNIQTKIQSILKSVNQSAVGFFEDNGVDFGNQRLVGAGDLDINFYLQRNWCLCNCGYAFAEGLLGFRLPTGKKVDEPKKLLLQPLGNNRHFEIHLGTQGGWEPRQWVNIKGDATFNYAFNKREKVAAAFKGATVKNIGPAVDADISWCYFLGNVDLTFLPTCNSCTGFDVGYNIYAKGKDKVSFETKTAKNFFGTTQDLDADLLEKRTDVIAHTIKVEFFHQGTCWETFAGWTHVVAGKNAPRDTNWHLGFIVFF